MELNREAVFDKRLDVVEIAKRVVAYFDGGLHVIRSDQNSEKLVSEADGSAAVERVLGVDAERKDGGGGERRVLRVSGLFLSYCTDFVVAALLWEF